MCFYNTNVEHYEANSTVEIQELFYNQIAAKQRDFMSL